MSEEIADTQERRTRRKLVGVVVSDKMDKTIVVRVDRVVQHPRFKKYIRRSTKYKAHDEKNDAGVGDRVEVAETRPLSKEKSFRLVKILERARIPGQPPRAVEPE